VQCEDAWVQGDEPRQKLGVSSLDVVDNIMFD